MSFSEEFKIISPTASERAGLTTVDQSVSPSILAKLRNIRSSVDQSIKEISSRVDQLSEKVNGLSTSSSKQFSECVPTRNWADNSTAADRTLLNWSDNEEDHDSTETVKLVETDKQLMHLVFSHMLFNSERQRIRNRYPGQGATSNQMPQIGSSLQELNSEQLDGHKVTGH